MRIAHLTDLHFLRLSLMTPLRLFGKRPLGLANALIGRRVWARPKIVKALLADVQAAAPDQIVITGDLTITAAPEEFAAAREALEPLLRRANVTMIPGNHDYYTAGSARSRRFDATFADAIASDEPTLEDGWPFVRYRSDVAFYGLNPCRAYLWNASGELPLAQLEALHDLLGRERARDLRKVVLVHYNLANRDGSEDRSGHRLVNAAALARVIRDAKVDLVLHGHDHHAHALDLGGVPVYDPGPSASWDRAAPAWHLYDLARGTLGVERRIYDGERFVRCPAAPWRQPSTVGGP